MQISFDSVLPNHSLTIVHYLTTKVVPKSTFSNHFAFSICDLWSPKQKQCEDEGKLK